MLVCQCRCSSIVAAAERRRDAGGCDARRQLGLPRADWTLSERAIEFDVLGANDVCSAAVADDGLSRNLAPD